MAFWLNLVYLNLESDPTLFWASFLKTHNSRSGLLHNNDYSLAVFKTGAIAVCECGKLTFILLGTWTKSWTFGIQSHLKRTVKIATVPRFLFFFTNFFSSGTLLHEIFFV